jgi:hypothetical protein
MLFSKKSTAKASLCRSNRDASFCKTCHPVFRFVILSEAKDLRFVARAETIAGKVSVRTES